MQKGFSLVEALVSIAILGVASTAYLKATSSFMVQGSTFVEQQHVSQMANTLSNLMLAHTQTLPVGSSRAELIAHLNRFAAAVNEQMELVQRAKGYTCDGTGPQLDPQAGSPPVLSASLFSVWSQGPATCVEIQFRPDIAADSQSIWVETIVRWASASESANSESRLPVLLSVVP